MQEEETKGAGNDDKVMFRVHMLAFMGPEQIREVWVPKDIVSQGSADLINRSVVNLGQNDRIPSRSHVSVSSGDVIEWVFEGAGSRYYMIELIGFHELTEDQFQGMVGSDASPLERATNRLRLVNGMDPLAGMPGEMKLATLLLLQGVLSDGGMCKSLVESGVVRDSMIHQMRAYVKRGMDGLRADAPDLSLA